MAVQRFNALKGLSVWMYQLLVLVQCVEPVLRDTLEMQLTNVMVYIYQHACLNPCSMDVLMPSMNALTRY